MKPTLAGVPQLVRYLSAFPPADRVAQATFRGPLSHCAARTLVLWQLRGDVLHLVGACGYTVEETSRYVRVPLAVDSVTTRAVRARETQAVSLPFRDSSLSSIDEPLVDDLVQRTGAVGGVNVPILHTDTVVGAFGFVVGRPWDPRGIGPTVVEAVAAALAMWMTHPRAEVNQASVPDSKEWSLDFSPRQHEVLRLVDMGMSTSSIAVTLAVSESSIKADLQRAMRALRTSDRREAARRARSLGLL